MTEGKIENPVEAFNTGEWYFNSYFAEFGDYFLVHAIREEEGESEEESEEPEEVESVLIDKLIIQ